ncbi:unnamed protein product [Urochloa humidicola]
MPPAKRVRRPPRAHTSIAAAADPRRSGGGWLSVRRDASKRPRRAEDDGTPLPDEILLGIFAGFLEIADLVRCAATCRRWRRLVSGEAAFIIFRRASRRPGPGPGGRFLPPLALGFFHQHDAAAPRFVPTASASRQFPGLREPSLSVLVSDGVLLDSSSRVVASRNGLLVVNLRRGGGKHARALKLRVCNPITGEVHALPPLTGKEGLGCYACTVLTADDYHGGNGTDSPRSPSSYRLLLVYSRRGFTAFRSYSSDSDGSGGGWSPEAKVTGAQLGTKQMGLTRNGVVAPGGRVAYWLAKDVLFELHLDTMKASVASLPRTGQGLRFDRENTLLGFTAEGRLCIIQLDLQWWKGGTHQTIVTLNVHTYKSHGGIDEDERWRWETKDDIRIESFSLDYGTTLKLRWFCERSGIVLFTASHWLSGGWISEVYAFSIHTQTLEKVASNGDENDADPWGNFYGYEMDQATFLASLAEPEREN